MTTTVGLVWDCGRLVLGVVLLIGILTSDGGGP